MTIYPIAGGRLINIAAFRSHYDHENTPFDGPWVQDVGSAEVTQDFAQWEPEVRALLDVSFHFYLCLPLSLSDAVYLIFIYTLLVHAATKPLPRSSCTPILFRPPGLSSPRALYATLTLP